MAAGDAWRADHLTFHLRPSRRSPGNTRQHVPKDADVMLFYLDEVLATTTAVSGVRYEMKQDGLRTSDVAVSPWYCPSLRMVRAPSAATRPSVLESDV